MPESPMARRLIADQFSKPNTEKNIDQKKLDQKIQAIKHMNPNELYKYDPYDSY